MDDPMSDDGKPLTFVVVYDHPKDMPDYWAVRVSVVLPGLVLPGNHVYGFKDLEQARGFIQHAFPGAVRMSPSPGDDPVIHEVWV
jgi:hypothetical protein